MPSHRSTSQVSRSLLRKMKRQEREQQRLLNGTGAPVRRRHRRRKAVGEEESGRKGSREKKKKKPADQPDSAEAEAEADGSSSSSSSGSSDSDDYSDSEDNESEEGTDDESIELNSIHGSAAAEPAGEEDAFDDCRLELHTPLTLASTFVLNYRTLKLRGLHRILKNDSKSSTISLTIYFPGLLEK